MRVARSIAAASVLSLSLSGCVSVSEFFAMLGFGSSEQAVEAPTYRVGDSFTFGSPAITWRVVAIDDDRVTWRSDQGDEQVTGRNPLLPALVWKSDRLGNGHRIISDQIGHLFPMKVGARTTFKAVVTTDKPPYGWSFDWQCEVLDRQDVVGASGMLDAFKVGCGRGSLDEIVFFYAPSIGHYVAKTSRSDGETSARVRHLIAYEKVNAGGALERVEFATVPHIGEPVAARMVDRPAGHVTSERIEDVGTAAGASVAANSDGIEERAKRLLARHTEVADTVSPLPPAKTGDSAREAAVSAPPETPKYRLVEAKLPPFPPRPKLNPQRDDAPTTIAVAASPELPMTSGPQFRSVTDVPMVEASRPSNPFDVSFVGKAHATADRTAEIVKRAREKALRTPGMGDEAMLAVRSVTEDRRRETEMAERSVDAEAMSPAPVASSIPASPRARVSGGSAGQVQVERSMTPVPTPTPTQPAASQQLAVRTEPTLSEDDASEAQKFYGVHLGTFLDPRRALLGWQHILRTHEDLLADLKPRIRRHDLGEEGVRYRLRVVPFVDAATAQSLCDKLSERGKYCRVSVE